MCTKTNTNSFSHGMNKTKNGADVYFYNVYLLRQSINKYKMKPPNEDNSKTLHY